MFERELLRGVSLSFLRKSLTGRGFLDKACFKSFRCYLNPLDGSIGKSDLHGLEIREEPSPGDPSGFQTNPTGLFRETATSDRSPYDRFFSSYLTGTHKKEL